MPSMRKELELALCKFTEASRNHLALYVFRICPTFKAHTVWAKFGKRFNVTK